MSTKLLAVVSLILFIDDGIVLSFVPSNRHRTAQLTNILSKKSLSTNTQSTESFLELSTARKRCRNYFHETSLKMAAEDFTESKYTEAAWSLIASLTKVAEYYQATSVEAPLLMDLMLNPTKHNAGENAESAKKVVEKALTKAGVNMSEFRSALETHMSKQAKISTSNSKVMGSSLQKVLETARVGQSILGVSRDVSC